MMILSLFVNAFGLTGTVYYKFIIDDVAQNALNDKLTLVSLAVMSLLALKCIFEYLRVILVTKVALKFDKIIVINFYNHVIRLPMEFFRTRRTGDIVSRFNDAAKIRDILSSVTVSAMMDLIMVVEGTIVLCWYNSVLFFLSLIPVTLYLILMGIFKKPIKESNRKLMENDAEFCAYLVESLSGNEMVKSVNGEELASTILGNKFEEFLDTELKYNYIEGLHNSLKMSVQNFFTILVLWIGVIQVLNNWYSIGTLITYNALLAYFMGPIERIIGLQSQLQSAIVESNRLFEIMDMAKEEKKENKEVKNESLLGDIVFNNVDFRYGTREKILKCITLRIKKGQKVAFVGESGSGKTTMAKLLLRFYEIEGGSIEINNQKLSNIDKGFLRERMAYVSQDYFFFSGTIRENLEFVKPGLSEEEMINVCKIVRMDDFIQTLQYKYDTLLEENAANLSAGQRQRLSIAKALLRNPEILIMDEATSNLDSITEIEIERALDNYQIENTRIMIAHRLSTIVNCDQIFVFKKGELLEAGTHEELINNHGYYYDLCKRQDLNKECIHKKLRVLN